MTKINKHINKQPLSDKKLDEILSKSYITWDKPKEQIWNEVFEKKELLPVKNSRIIYLQFKRLAIAAILLLITGASALLSFYTKKTETFVGQQSEIILPDQSKVILYSQSVLTYKPLIWKFNRVVKFEGEASFEVTKGEKFEVKSKNGKTEVLGTQFIVYTRNRHYNVSCISGRVKVTERAFQKHVIISTNQKAILKSDGVFEILNLENPQTETSVESKNKKIDEEIYNLMEKDNFSSSPILKENEQKETGNMNVISKQGNNPEMKKMDDANRPESQKFEEVQNELPVVNKNTNQTENKEQNFNQEDKSSQNKDNIQSKDKLRVSLTPEQIGILENQEMSKEEKKRAFLGSLSPEQQKLLEEQNKERYSDDETPADGANKGDIIKEQQKMQVREKVQKMNGRENQEQQKIQNRELKENSKQKEDKGTGKGSGR